jgi:hypothetical protein
MGAGSSARATAQSSEEGNALRILHGIEEGRACLAGGTHSWCTHEGQHGSGRACERCFTVEDMRCKPSKVVFRIRPQCEDAQPTAAKILDLCRTELRRVDDGGCIAGGEHAWVDVRKTLVRLTGEGRCCERCGLVESIVTPLEQALGATNTRLCLPNLIGRFGPAVPKEYRLMYGGAGTADGQPTSMPQHNVPDPVAATGGGADA